jgi:glycosidase
MLKKIFYILSNFHLCIVFVLHKQTFAYIMKIRLSIILLLVAVFCNAQLLSWSPSFIKETSSTITITANSNFGNQSLKNIIDTNNVYVHIGAITNLSATPADWKYSKFTWATTNAAAKANYIGNNKYVFTINGGLTSFFNITNATEKVLKIAILFRTGDGSKVLRNSDGGDMYIPVYDNNLAIRIDTPFRTPFYKLGNEVISKSVGDNISFTANTNINANLELFLNGASLTTSNTSTTASATGILTSTGNQVLIAKATDGVSTVADTINFLVTPPVTIAEVPTGMQDGINYDAADATKVTLVLYAPLKNKVSVIGDFNNWTETLLHQMNKNAAGTRFWITLTGLTPNKEYGYQFKIDNTLTVADYYAEKILDPWSDQYITATIYPNLLPYPANKTTGIVSVFQTAKTPYVWQNNFTRPNKNNLFIYELLVRDFTADKSFKTLKDSIGHLKRMGITAIEIMPVIEFEGNNSWGYNPSFFMAVDKAYGTETAFKQLIDECHKQGIAVIMDIALNHAFGQSPMVQMYWDAVNNKPAANNPWFNVNDKHPFGVGYDFNHESQATIDFLDRVVAHWLINYKIDGFRWDLSKGFTQFNSGTNVGLWGNYDASRIAIWKRIYDKMMTISPNSYCILEHFADNAEEVVLANYGMMLWGNANYNYRSFSKGDQANGTDFSWATSLSKGFAKQNLITYSESHDEERIVYDTKSNGLSSGTVNTKDLNTALKRQEALAAFLTMTPGPKMMWQFQELGYDFSINTCTNLTINNNCRLDEKPIRWDYENNPNRLAIKNAYTKLLALKNNPAFSTAFTGNNYSFSNANSLLRTLTVVDTSIKIVVVANLDFTTYTAAAIPFPATGLWFGYNKDTVIKVTGSTTGITLQPNEYMVFTNKNINNIPTSIFSPTGYNVTNLKMTISPNPITNVSLLKYQLPESGQVNIKLMGIDGKLIANIFNGKKTKGEQQIEINKSIIKTVFATGTYFLQIDINGKKQTEKIYLVN